MTLSFLDALDQLVSGDPDKRAVKELAAKRLDICEKCVENYSPTLKICRECKCYMPFKTTFKDASCPIGKW